MKKIIVVVIIVLLFFSGCNIEKTTLIISNNSSKTLTDIVWNGKKYQVEYKFLNTNYISTGELNPGDTCTLEVDPGGGYIFFRISNFKDIRTQEMIILNKGETQIFYFLDSTDIVYDNKNTTISGLK